MSANTATVAPEAPETNLLRALSKYERPNLRKAVWQLVNTFTPYVALWALMAYLVRQGHSYWFTLALAVVAAALLVRIFIVFHDCGHGSFFVSRRANRIVGYLTGILTCTPYEDWRHVHAAHHATTGDLDRRGKGRRMDADGQGVSGGAEAHAVGLPVHPESLRPVGVGSGVPVRGQAAVSSPRGREA